MKLQITISSEEDAHKAVNLLNTYLGTTAMQTEEPEQMTDEEALNYILDNTPDANGDVEVDAKGTPWLEAVHAGTKTKNQDGTWKKKRGVDETVLAEAEAEARGEVAMVPPTTPAEMPLGEPMQPTVSIDDVHGKWAECMQAGKVTVEGAMAMYADIGVDPSQLQTNETERAKLYAHLDGLLAA